MAESPQVLLLHCAHPSPTSGTELPVLSCPQQLGQGTGDRGRLRPSRDRALGVLPGQGDSRGGAEGLWQGLVLMAGTHRVLRLGTEPRGQFCRTRGRERHRGQQEVAEPSQHLRQAQGTRQVLTAAGTASSGRWELGRRAGRGRGERGDTEVTALGELLSLLREQEQAGTVQARPAESHQTLGATKHRATKH